jgi:hypothetical protein
VSTAVYTNWCKPGWRRVALEKFPNMKRLTLCFQRRFDGRDDVIDIDVLATYLQHVHGVLEHVTLIGDSASFAINPSHLARVLQCPSIGNLQLVLPSNPKPYSNTKTEERRRLLREAVEALPPSLREKLLINRYKLMPQPLPPHVENSQSKPMEGEETATRQWP